MNELHTDFILFSKTTTISATIQSSMTANMDSLLSGIKNFVVFDNNNNKFFTSLVLMVLPVFAAILCGLFLKHKRKSKWNNNKNDTMQRNGSKAVHNNNTKPTAHQSQMKSQSKNLDYSKHTINSNQTNIKHDSSDSGLSAVGQKTKERKQRSRKRPDGSNKSALNAKESLSGNGGSDAKLNSSLVAAGQKRASGFSLDEWRYSESYCYERESVSSCDEEKSSASSLHNPAHRNSDASEATISDDLNSNSSNDASSETNYKIAPKISKKLAKRQKRQQKRKVQNKQQQTTSSTDFSKIPNVASNKETVEHDNENKEITSHRRRSGNVHSRVFNSRNHTNQPQNELLRQFCSTICALRSYQTHEQIFGLRNTLSGSESNTSINSDSNSSTQSINGINSCSKCNILTAFAAITGLTNSSCSSSNCSPTGSPAAAKRGANCKSPLYKEMILRLVDHELVCYLRRFILDPNLLRVYGFPVESVVFKGCVEIYKCLPKHFAHNDTVKFGKCCKKVGAVINCNDGLYISYPPAEYSNGRWPYYNQTDSGHVSGNTSPNSLDSDSSENSEDDHAANSATICTETGRYSVFQHYEQSSEKHCSRCKRTFKVTESGDYLTLESCNFHWGRLDHSSRYTCCSGNIQSEGCEQSTRHVWTGTVFGLNGPYSDFVRTTPSDDPINPLKIFALDCEMSFTGRGLEVTKITVISFDGEVVYEHFVQPPTEIVDFNTRFSGISEKDFRENSAKIKTLYEVQQDLLKLFDSDTILIGHALENDLRALRIVHNTVIDTSIVFPHHSGFPYRNSLKQLTSMHLNKNIQTGQNGHCSREDARSCLELMWYKINELM